MRFEFIISLYQSYFSLSGEKIYIKKILFLAKRGFYGRSPGPLYISYYVYAGSSVDRTAEKLVYLGLAQI